MKRILLITILSVFMGGCVHGTDIGTRVAGQSLYRVSSNTSEVTWQVHKRMGGGSLGRISAGLVDEGIDRTLYPTIKKVGGPDPLMNRTEQLVHGEVASVIVQGLFSIFE